MLTDSLELELLEQPPAEPQDEDAFVFPSGPLGSLTGASYAGEHLGEFCCWDDALEAVRARMDEDAFYPTIWTVNDHGGHEPLED